MLGPLGSKKRYRKRNLAVKNGIENEIDFTSENGASAKVREAPPELFLGAKIDQKPSKDAFQATLFVLLFSIDFFTRKMMPKGAKKGAKMR